MFYVFSLYIQIKRDGNCMFNAVLEEIQFDSDKDERWDNAERLRRQVIAFFCIKKDMFTDWITGHIRNKYGWCDKDSEMELGPFSLKSYLKYMLGDCVWGDFIVLNLIHFLKKTPAYRNTPVPDIIRKKWVINLSSKPLTDGEQSLLQKGPKFAVSSSRVPLTEYIAVTKRICDELGENTTGKDCTEIYQKTKEILHRYKKKKSFTQNITKEEREAIKTLREDTSRVVLTADKGVALVVMDKSQYVNKCMALLDDTKVYKPCKDTTKKLHRDVQETL